MTAFSSLGQGQSYTGLGYENMVGIKEDVVIITATRLGVTPAQVALRWGIQRGYSVIPKSENEQRVKENFSIEGFNLSNADMEKMKSFEKNFIFNYPGHYCMFFNTPCLIWD